MKYLRLVEGLKKVGLTKLAVLGIATLSLSSCLKNKGPEYVEYDVSGLSIYNALPGIDKADFVLDNQYVYTYQYGNFDNSTYLSAFSGTRRAAFYEEGKVAITDTIRTKMIGMEKDKLYSLFLIGTQEEPEILLNKDEWEAPAQGNANIRFINLSPDIGNLDLVAIAEEEEETLFSEAGYKGIQDFLSIPAKTYTLKLVQGDTQIDTKPNVQIESGKTYTVIATGLADTEETALQVSIKVNRNR